MTEPAAAEAPSTMRRDIASAYVASAARVGAWVVVSAIVMREFGSGGFGLLALVRGTLSILNYGTLGIGPAMIHHLSRAARAPAEPVPALPVEPMQVEPSAGAALSYANPTELADPLREVLAPLRATYAAGLKIAVIAAAISGIVLYGYASHFERFHRVGLFQSGVFPFVLFMGLGAILRLVSDAPAAVLQVRGRIAFDNLLQTLAESAWVVGVALSGSLKEIALWFMISGGVLLVGRLMAAASITRVFVFELPRAERGMGRALLTTGGVIVAGQIADYLYAPANLILINRFLGPWIVAYYAPALQIDAALLLLVSALAAVLMPKAALAHAADDRARVMRYYLRGTLVSAAALTLAAVAVCVLSPWLLPLWLGLPMSETRQILPLVMIHTVVGGSGAVGRSILIAIGKARPFTIAALVAGVGNVVLAYVFVRHLNLGLRGIVYATVIVVVARAGIWMPWYVIRTLRRMESQPAAGAGPLDASTM
jgi:O-antigen/teichoic acid export membrane protein